jgi:serine/threonine protein kinase
VANAASAPKLCTTCGARYPADALFCPTDGAPLQNAAAAQAQRASDSGADPYVGRELAGHIEVRQLAGVGAMGRVYRAFQKGIERDVAVKILHRELSANAQLVARFHREAKVASRLLHPNVVQVHLAGQLPDGALYIVMEYLDGLSLQSALAAAGGAVQLPRALHIALQICDAVGEAHTQGITHRDLKPENVMLVHRGEDADFVKVLDFGIARLDWGEQSMATAAGLIFGTARYISPEGARGEQVGPQGDVYSIATLVFQMLSGRTPFEGEQAVGLLVQQIHDAPPPLRSIARSSYVPDPIADVVQVNLSKDKSKRAPDARALGRALLEAAKKAGLSAEDLVPRSILLGARAAGAVQLQSMQRTRQLQLDRPIDGAQAPRASQSTEIAESEPLRTAYETPEPPVSQSQLPRVSVKTPPPSTPSLASQAHAQAQGATQKWVPPASVKAQMDAGPPSNVDTTMDDATATPPPAMPNTAPPNNVTARLEPQGTVRMPGAPHLPPTVFDDGDEDEESPMSQRASRWRRIAIVVLCFLLGIALTLTLAVRLKLLGAGGSSGAREVASSDPIAAPSASARDAIPRPVELSAVVVPSLDAGNARPSGKAPVTATGPFRTMMDVSPAKPRVGQAVDLVVKVTTSSGGAPKKPIEDPHFTIAGSSIGGDGTAELPAFGDEPGIFRASFTFLAAGKYEVTFHAKSDGVALRSTRSLVTLDAVVTPPAPMPASVPTDEPPTPAAPSAAPSASVKWM